MPEIIGVLIAAAFSIAGSVILVAYYGGRREEKIYARLSELERDVNGIGAIQRRSLRACFEAFPEKAKHFAKLVSKD